MKPGHCKTYKTAYAATACIYVQSDPTSLEALSVARYQHLLQTDSEYMDQTVQM